MRGEVLTALRSGRYPRLASFAVTPAARRGPERGRMVVVVNAGLTARGEAPFLRARSWMPDSVSLTTIVCGSCMSACRMLYRQTKETDLLVGKTGVLERVEVRQVALQTHSSVGHTVQEERENARAPWRGWGPPGRA